MRQNIEVLNKHTHENLREDHRRKWTELELHMSHSHTEQHAQQLPQSCWDLGATQKKNQSIEVMPQTAQVQ